MPEQLRKTIEYALELWKDWNFNRMLGTKRVCGELFFSPHICPSKVRFAGFGKKSLRGKWDEKRRNPRSSRPKISFTSAVPGQLCKTMDRICSRAMKRLTCRKDSRNYTCVCGAPCPFLHICPSKVHFLDLEMGWDRLESTILPSKVHTCRFWIENCERKWTWEK